MESTAARPPVLTIAIPTYRRGSVVLNTINQLLALNLADCEILVLDQTIAHDAAVECELRERALRGDFQWVRLPIPSITRAMNVALQTAKADTVLFLDDDVDPDPDLVAAHIRSHSERSGFIIAGRVLQPWHFGAYDDEKVKHFSFNSRRSHEVPDFMGGNFSVDRIAALRVGGFDENFVRVAYRFEAEFALRWRRAGGRIWYESSALIHHLKASDGGTRVFGDYLRTAVPSHSVGEYYFAFASRPSGWLRTLFVRPFRAVATRHHLRRPWWIPVTLVAEFGGIVWALWLTFRGPRLLKESEFAEGSPSNGV